MAGQLDYTNRPIPADETPETVIKVWKVSPSAAEFDDYLIRGWQGMLTFVRDQMERMLEDVDDEATAASIHVELVEMTRQELDEAEDDV